MEPEGYGELLTELVSRIREARLRAAVSVNRETVLLYWGIGREILTRQEERGWGAKVIDQLAEDLGRTFPGVKGFSARNLKYMRALAHAWPDEAIVQQLLHKLPWGHLVRLLDKVKNPAEREWYVRACIDQGWSRNVLVMQIQSGLYRREGAAVTNFERTPPAAGLRPRATDAQGPLQLRLPHPRRARPRAGRSSAGSSSTCATSCSSSAAASRSSAARSPSRSAARSSAWTCSSSTCTCAASS